jgi:hypothetical protein
MNIQFYPDELDWVNAQLHNRDPNDKSLVGAVCWVALRADPENYELFRPFMHIMMRKYPADPERLKREREDRGAT